MKPQSVIAIPASHKTGWNPAPITLSAMVSLAALFAASVFFTSTVLASDDAERVVIDTGLLRGQTQDGLLTFKDIPYAAPPSGELRWRPPQLPSGWEGERDATQFKTYCPQSLREGYSTEDLATSSMSEDCLKLNVWTPAQQGDEPLPVMVWILPGSFRVGAAALPRYDGAALAKQGVVVISFDYRLGMLGQFAHPDLSAAQADEPLGNYNLMDQVAALQWVQRNIEQFGGDPGNVTIFGMSAGGVSVNYLMAMPAAKGLFHKAMSQSSAIRVSAPRKLAEPVGRTTALEDDGSKLAEHYQLNDKANVVSGLRQLSAEQIMSYQSNPGLFSPGSLNPVVDGKLVITSVGEVFRQGKEHPVPYLSGATSWEGSLVAFMQSADPLLGAFGMTREQAVALYGDVNEKTLINLLESDFFFSTQRYLAKHHEINKHPAWLYYFSRVLEAHKDQLSGAGHGAETPYVFQTLDSLTPPTNMTHWGNTISETDRDYARMISAIWVQFAKTGNPNGTDLPDWQSFGSSGQPVMDFGQQAPEQFENFLQKRMEFFDQHYDDGKL